MFFVECYTISTHRKHILSERHKFSLASAEVFHPSSSAASQENPDQSDLSTFVKLTCVSNGNALGRTTVCSARASCTKYALIQRSPTPSPGILVCVVILAFWIGVGSFKCRSDTVASISTFSMHRQPRHLHSILQHHSIDFLHQNPTTPVKKNIHIDRLPKTLR